MKLLQKNTRYLLKSLPLVMLGCTLLFFLLLRRQTLHLQEKQLLLKQENVLRKFRSGNLDTAHSIVGEFEITHDKTFSPDAYHGPTDTSIYYPSRNAFVPFQMMTTDVKQGNRTLQLTTFVSSVEIAHLMIAVLGSQLLIYLVLFYAVFRINKNLSIRLWQPFYGTMDTLSAYNILSNQSPKLEPQTGIDEFNELNKVIGELGTRNLSAYNSQKQFVENASHEIQTPLAIIRSKIELLMEQPGITAESAELIIDIANANNRLSKLNKTLILLSKIQNNQFIERNEVDMSQLITQTLESFNRQYLENMPAVKTALQGSVRLSANRELLEILCSNLIRNAIIHNLPNGYIYIRLDREQLVIENPSQPLSIDPQALFERFRTGDDTSKKTTGLGLALVKQISDLHGYTATYQIENNLHRLTVNF